MGKGNSGSKRGYVIPYNGPKYGGKGEQILISSIPSYEKMEKLNKLQGFNSGLSREEKDAYGDYQGNAYEDFNKALLKQYDENGVEVKPLGAYHQQLLDNMEAGSKELGTKGLTLYRYQGLSFLNNLVKQYGVKDYTELAGKYGIYRNVVSSTYDPDKPSQFWGAKNFVIFENVPSSLKGHLMDGHNWEGEFLMNRNVMVKIKSVEQVGYYWVTRVKIVRQGNKVFSNTKK